MQGLGGCHGKRAAKLRANLARKEDHEANRDEHSHQEDEQENQRSAVYHGLGI